MIVIFGLVLFSLQPSVTSFKLPCHRPTFQQFECSFCETRKSYFNNRLPSFFISRDRDRGLSFETICLFSSSTASSIDYEPAKHASTSANQATFLTSSINLLKNCVGAGVFSLNARVYKLGLSRAQYWYVLLLTYGMAVWASYNFYTIGESCRLTDSSNFKDAWSKTVSASSSWIIQFVITVAPIVSCIANTIVLVDVLKMLLKFYSAPIIIVKSRPLLITLLSSLVLYPICTVKNLSGLKSISAVGLMGQFSAMLAMVTRLVDGTYRKGGSFFTGLPSVSSIATSPSTAAHPSQWFVLASLLSYCFVTHYNAPRYYTELANKEKDRLQFFKMAATSYSAAATVYTLTMLIVYKLFGFSGNSFALNNFSPKDSVAVLAFFAFGTSVLASFPLIFLNVRNFFSDAAISANLKSISSTEAMTALLLCGIGAVTCFCQDIGKLGALAGALFGTSMMFIFPPIMYISALRKQGTQHNRLVIALNVFLLLCGIGIGSVGTVNSLSAFFR